MNNKQDFLAKYGTSEHLHSILDNNDPDSAYWHLLDSHSLDQSHADRLVASRHRNLRELGYLKTNKELDMHSAIDSNDHYRIQAVAENKNATPEVLHRIIKKPLENYPLQIGAALRNKNLSREDALHAINHDEKVAIPLKSLIAKRNSNLTKQDLGELFDKHPHPDVRNAALLNPNLVK